MSIAIRLCLTAIIATTLWFDSARADSKIPTPTLITSTLATMAPGQTAWIAANWKGGATDDVCGFKVTAAPSSGTTVSYPSNRDYSSGYRDDMLSTNEIDYTAFLFTVPDNASGSISIPFTASYGNCDKNGDEKNGNGNQDSIAVHATIPIKVVTGAAFTQLTTTLGPIKAGTASWVQVSFRGEKPGLNNFALSVTDPDGSHISYPNNTTSAHLAQNSTLGVAQTDYVSFNIDTTGMGVGVHTLKTLITYNGTSVAGTLAVTVS